jgi:hypothetical protein
MFNTGGRDPRTRLSEFVDHTVLNSLAQTVTIEDLAVTVQKSCESHHWPRILSDIQSHQDAVSVRQITDDPANRCRETARQGWNGEDLITLREVRCSRQADHVDPKPPFEVLVANLFQIGHGTPGLWRLTGDIQELKKT